MLSDKIQVSRHTVLALRGYYKSTNRKGDTIYNIKERRNYSIEG
jgi:hypothetical protein